MNLTNIVGKARHSRFYLWLLNQGLDRMIPFNKPHGFRILEISPEHVMTRIPYKKRNFNHIRGLHACALATLSEFTTGFMLITRLDPGKFRLIMQKLEMEYHYQGKMDALAEFTVTEDWLSEKIFSPLKSREAVIVECVIKIHDTAGNHLTTGRVYWQVKSWEKVRTKVS